MRSKNFNVKKYEKKINSFRLAQEKDFLRLLNQTKKTQIFKSDLLNKFI